jgi:hypothetical protein
MKIKDIRSLVQTRPFRSLKIHLSDGRMLKVPHLDYIFMPPGVGDTFIIVDRHGSFHVIDVRLVTEVEYKNGSAAV